MKEIKITECPFCGGSELTEAMGRYISPKGNGFAGSVLYSTLCLECGSVVRSYVKDIKPFIKKKNER